MSQAPDSAPAAPQPALPVPAAAAEPPARHAPRLTLASLHAGWGLGMLALAGVALVFAGSPPGARTLLALALAAAPGLLAVTPLRGDGARDVALLVWTGMVGAAVAVAGGLSGPLTAAALLPALVGAAFGSWARGVGGSCLIAAAVSVWQVMRTTSAPELDGADAAALASGVVALTALASAAATALVARRAALPGPPSAAAPPVAPPTDELASLRAELAQAQAARARAEAEARARARFIAEMSHELRTPLNAILGFSDIMRTRLFGPIPDRYGEYAELIHQSGGHLTALINDVLDLSKIDADRYELRRERFDAAEPAEAALRLLRQGADSKGVKLRGDLPGEPLEVDADPRALKQMALNLLSNALKFTPPGGEVVLSLRAEGADLVLVVADTGVGIAPEELGQLGDAYAQGEAGRGQGTGLGLSLVRAFARLHGGELKLQSRLGEGTTATVRLPVVPPAGPAAS